MDVQGKPGHSVAVIGDGAITGGMAWEAMNHAGGMGSKVVVILNDNGQVSLPTFYNAVKNPVGALSQTLGNTSEPESQRGLSIQNDFAKIETSEGFQNARNFAKAASRSLLPEQLQTAAAKVDEYARDFVKTVPFKGSGAGGKGELFEQLGFYYVGPIDGHNMETLTQVLKNIKKDHEDGTINKPVLLHIKTQKGKGYEPAQRATDKLHAVKPKFNLPKVATPSDKIKVAKDPLTKVQDPRRGRPRSTTRSWPSRPRCPAAPASASSRSASGLGAPSTWASRSSTPPRSPPAWPPEGSSRSAPSTPRSCSAPTTRWPTTSACRSCPCA
ncbi:unnamed protein product [Prorocentrum cordatum]|uniref:1-deoxy-D-xylulose-5-phosphate synthase n=1 Tax=Prorocentrum cordatum TaxID=2364126 RepID=A0ABN9QF81_9DINO|nr:unnamed protein product [Polarella glacialis]